MRARHVEKSFSVAIREQRFLSPGTYRVGDATRILTADDLAEYKNGTIAAISSGLSIPVLSRHAKMGSDEGGPQSSKEKSSALDGVGWLIDMKQEPDGSLVHIVDVTDPKALEKIDNGSIKFTSPELCENYVDGKGRKFGRMIRHTALSSTPRNPDQGEFSEAMAAQFSQFSMDDLVGEQFDHILTDDPVDAPEIKAASQTIARALLESLEIYFPAESDLDLSEAEIDKLVATIEVIEMAKKKASAAAEKVQTANPESTVTPFGEDEEKKKKTFPPEENSNVSDDPNPDTPADQVANTEDPPENPDMPTDPKTGQKASAVIAQLSALNIELPSDLEFPDGPYLDVLLAALKTATKIEAESQVEEKTEDLTVREEQNMGSQFDEFDESTMSPVEKALLEKVLGLETSSAQFSEERQAEKNNMGRARLVAKIRTAKIPAGMKKEILAMSSSVQFSEGDEVSTMSISSVVDLVEKYLPEGMQFDASEASEEKHKDGDGFFDGDSGRGELSDDEARSRVDEQLKTCGYRPKGILVGA